eukprot:6209468-Pleurochrysis_carterae.AAC.6
MATVAVDAHRFQSLRPPTHLRQCSVNEHEKSCDPHSALDSGMPDSEASVKLVHMRGRMRTHDQDLLCRRSTCQLHLTVFST